MDIDQTLYLIKNQIDNIKSKWTEFYVTYKSSGLATPHFSSIEDVNTRINNTIDIFKNSKMESIFSEFNEGIKGEIKNYIQDLNNILISSLIPSDKLIQICGYLNNIIRFFYNSNIYFRIIFFKNDDEIIQNIQLFNTKINIINENEKKSNELLKIIENLHGDAKIKTIANSFNNAKENIKIASWGYLIATLVFLIATVELALFYFNIPNIDKFQNQSIPLFYLELYMSLFRLLLVIPFVFLIRFCWSQYIFNRDLKTSYALKAAIAESTPSILTQLDGRNADETIKEVFKTIYSDNKPISNNDDDFKKIMSILKGNNLKELTSLINALKK
ncbi:hypothetical protein [Pigmentibacter ruber]|uniref:hypothetical protein n=1 Tax=Pigmentibacter ruber TaxID=2683196 RepID=UPI00131E8375|nr:hypothetical protein [Pigmentibacter ruber]